MRANTAAGCASITMLRRTRITFGFEAATARTATIKTTTTDSAMTIMRIIDVAVNSRQASLTPAFRQRNPPFSAKRRA